MRGFDFKPGDLIVWVHAYNNELVLNNEELWSTIERHYVPIGRNLVHMCISVNNETYSWLNVEGLFTARVDDTRLVIGGRWRPTVVPRKRR